MTNETILTDEHIFALAAETDIASVDPKVDVLMFSRDEMLQAARAIERAVLQSPEIQALRKDAERYRYLRDDLRHDDERWGAVSIWNHSNIPAAEFDSAVDAAMEKQP